MNTFIYSSTNKRYHTLDYFYKNKFGCKVSKISLNAGFSCPNLDGTVGYGGCIYCSKTGSGEYGGNPLEDLTTQFNKQKQIMDKKWPNSKYIAYFQARTNTYAPLSILKDKYEEVLKIDNVVGIAIATRSDSISDDVLNYLEELNKKTFVTVELGLQTIHKKTSTLINRCHTLENFEKMVKKLQEKHIFTTVHIINGLPYETEEMMLQTVKYLNKINIDGIKIHMLSVLKNTPLEKLYEKDKFPLLSLEEYVKIICQQLRYLNPKIVVERITGDPDINDLIAPSWLPKKRIAINSIDKYMAKNNIYQGDKL